MIYERFFSFSAQRLPVTWISLFKSSVFFVELIYRESVTSSSHIELGDNTPPHESGVGPDIFHRQSALSTPSQQVQYSKWSLSTRWNRVVFFDPQNEHFKKAWTRFKQGNTVLIFGWW